MCAVVLTDPDRPAGSDGGRDPGARAALAAAVLTFLVITLDAVVVNVALPAVRRDLGGGVTGLQWVVDGYTLMFAALLPSAGALSVRIGARRAVGAGMLVFVVASAACALAPSLAALVAARFLQGAAAALGGPLVMPPLTGVLLNAVPPPRAGVASGVFNTSRQVGGALAPSPSSVRCLPGPGGS